MKLAFISDLHLRHDWTQKKNLHCLKVLEAIKEETADEFWLLGDIFDIIIGNFDYWIEIHQPFFNKIKELQKAGIRIHWIQGNHDFYLEEFLEKLKIQAHDGWVEKSYSGKKCLFGHGDLVDQNDLKYLKWRKTSRSAPFRFAIKYFMPEFLVKHFFYPYSLKKSSSSRKNTQNFKIEKTRQLFLDFYREKTKVYDLVACGHSHLFEESTKAQKKYFNLGTWTEEQVSYAIWNSETHQVEIKQFH